jgi:uncharacterized protein (DUF885 family)
MDRTRADTYWFNTARPTAGTGWDLEGVAFHEAVPGHHLQLSRIQQLTGLPNFQRQRSITVFSEGWDLYAEQLAEETRLHSETRAILGATSNALMRGARFVVDTGLHARGWSRDRALGYYTSHVPVPESFLANEIDRYIVWPDQALAYLTGKRELLRLREEAERFLGGDFSLPQFHAACSTTARSRCRCCDRACASGWTARRVRPERGASGGGAARMARVSVRLHRASEAHSRCGPATVSRRSMA